MEWKIDLTMMNAIRRLRTPGTWSVLLPLALGVAGLVLSACGGGGKGEPASQVASVAEDASGGKLSVQELVPLLTRTGVGGDGVGLDLTYAPPQFFEITGLKRPDDMDSRPTLAFILQETVHEGELPVDPPETFLEVDQGDPVPPYDAHVTAEDPHHRTVRLLFPQPEGWSASANEDSPTLTVVVPWSDGTISTSNTFVWQLPLDLGGGDGHVEG